MVEGQDLVELIVILLEVPCQREIRVPMKEAGEQHRRPAVATAGARTGERGVGKTEAKRVSTEKVDYF